MAEMNGLMWFRKGLRVHDNPALDHAARSVRLLYPVFVLDPRFLRPDPSAPSPGSARSGLNRIRFLLESLSDLDSSLRRLGSRLLVLKGDDPADVILKALKEWKIGEICYEFDTKPYALAQDKRIKDFACASGIKVFSPVSHTLFDPAEIIKKNGGKPPLTYQSFIKIAGQPQPPILQTFSCLPPVGNAGACEFLDVPLMEELGYGDVGQEGFSPFHGGESEALKRLKESLDDKCKGSLASKSLTSEEMKILKSVEDIKWVANFEKPKGDPSAFLKPATTVLSPYLKFGCLSSRYFYKCLQDVYANVKKHTSPPVSLVGQIPWSNNEELFVAWREGRTGYPWIDAIMIQFIHWEKGRDVFERLLIDHDWAINNVINHDFEMKECRRRMGEAYALNCSKRKPWLLNAGT
ncbi:(6-4)DNA photolyase [Acorus calamus]|uniref:(6-4)DNA photolyase n=1 Tax=Acorus calamus TaxID=4465 RepID=A0AAV9EGG2_ACOCL|nr:(6-4)DNA photolyase [Acorus calamus]